MLFSLHRRALHNTAVPAVAIEKYYAIDYLRKYYIGRVLSIANILVTFKFLHRVLDRYIWSGRDDIEEVTMSCIFFGPIALKGTGPFVVVYAVQLTRYSMPPAEMLKPRAQRQ